ncbi:MAG: protein-glutamate O-methyltransferase CheR [Deltaproteobacteria bacterium]|nr:protein-glutamate O-methyltransferase CheR [Deltaproteobacteria bacterium]
MHVEEFRLLRDLINRFCGISFGEDARFVMERRLKQRIDALGLSGFGAYYQYLRYHSRRHAEIERAVECLTTNETYFFREDYQLWALRDQILPELRARRSRESLSKRLSIWSAGCSTGEEVYTIAMIVAASGLFDGWDVRIFGNDIARNVLHTARRAVYGSSSFRAMPPGYERFFTETPEGRVVDPSIRAMCHFGHLNLLERGRTAIVGRVDVILCRNVLIYFDPDSRSDVIQTFYQRLFPGGYLLLGHSESLLNASTAFELVHLDRDLVYRRAASRTREAGTDS